MRPGLLLKARQCSVSHMSSVARSGTENTANAAEQESPPQQWNLHSNPSYKTEPETPN